MVSEIDQEGDKVPDFVCVWELGVWLGVQGRVAVFDGVNTWDCVAVRLRLPVEDERDADPVDVWLRVGCECEFEWE